MNGDKLAKLRKEAGLYQSEVAEALGIKQPQISRWENDRDNVPDKYIPYLAELFGVDESELREPPEPEPNEPPAGRTVQTLSDVGRWREQIVQSDLGFQATAILSLLPALRDDDADLPVVVARREELEQVGNVPREVLDEHWDDVLESGFVEKVKNLDHVLRLIFPED